VGTHGLRAAIASALEGLDPRDAGAVEDRSRRIREEFRNHAVPDPIAAEGRGAYRALGGPAVAVRSSATAEDLPGLSFAGQQESLLDVHGEQALA